MTDLYEHFKARVPEGWSRVMAMPLPEGGAPGSYAEATLSTAFGDVWLRPNLSVRERRIAVLTVLTLFGRDDITRLHVSSALSKGDLDFDDLEELAVTLAVYAGAPAATTFYLLIEEVRRARRQDGQAEEGESGA